MAHSQAQKIGITLIGNPGSGKSTILNGIAGKSVFRSGISLGGGLTSVLQREDCDDSNVTLFDTPGLSDLERKKQAGKEIDKVLSTEMPIKIAFVVTLEKGRVRPSDAYTLKVVLEAIKSIDVNNKFGVIINQLTPSTIRALRNEKVAALKVRKGITGSFHTSHWLYVENISELEDKYDGMLTNDELTRFFVGLPETKPPQAVVEKVDTADLEEMIEKQEQIIKRIEEAKENALAEMRGELESQLDEAREREERIRVELEELRNGHLKDIIKRATGKAFSALTNPASLISSVLSLRSPRD